MADKTQDERMVSIVITIMIDSVPNSQVGALEEQAFQVGDEYGARVNVSKSEPRGVPQVRA